jgi:3-oxoacyl-[acyl-carrier protein] reductase
VSEFGKVDYLINNAGIVRDKTMQKMDKDMWDDVIATDLTGVFNCTKHALPYMVEQSYGRIISISSVVGLMGNIGQVNYSAAKSGIIGFTKSLAQEVAAKGITVNAIAPGFTATEMVTALPDKIKDRLLEKIPMHRFAKPEEISALVSFLMSDNAAYITGQVISINGGLYM